MVSPRIDVPNALYETVPLRNGQAAIQKRGDVWIAVLQKTLTASSRDALLKMLEAEGHEK